MNDRETTLLDAAAAIGVIALLAFGFGRVQVAVALGVLALLLLLAWGVTRGMR